MNSPLVSTVITTYKRELKYLLRAVNSILSQDYKNIELFIVDDSPSDYEKRGEIKAYFDALGDERVTYIQNEKQSGACFSRNVGIKHSHGDYIAFLDDDDEWTLNKLTIMMEKMLANPEVGLVYGGTFFTNEMNGKTWSSLDEKKLHRGSVYHRIVSGNFVGSTSNPLLKKSVLIEAGAFDVEQPAMQDWDLWIRMAEKCEFDFVAENLLKYYVHEGEHITKVPEKRIKGLMRLNEKQKDYLAEHKDILSARYHYMMRLYVAGGDTKNAMKYYKMSVAAQPKAVIKNIVKLKAFLRLFFKGSKGWN